MVGPICFTVVPDREQLKNSISYLTSTLRTWLKLLRRLNIVTSQRGNFAKLANSQPLRSTEPQRYKCDTQTPPVLPSLSTNHNGRPKHQHLFQEATRKQGQLLADEGTSQLEGASLVHHCLSSCASLRGIQLMHVVIP